MSHLTCRDCGQEISYLGFATARCYHCKTKCCMVCNKPTDKCVPSPFLPYSGWRCDTCIKSHRIPYKDLLVILNQENTNSYEEALESFHLWWKGSDQSGPDDGAEYAEKYLLPTLEFFERTKDEAWKEANRRK